MNYALLNKLADAAATVDAAVATEEMSTGAMIIYTLVQILPMILIFVVFYFMLIRPQRKKDKAAKEMLKNLKVGDRICTIGGFYGTIAHINEKGDTITLKMGSLENTVVIARWAVRSVENVKTENDSQPEV